MDCNRVWEVRRFDNEITSNDYVNRSIVKWM